MSADTPLEGEPTPGASNSSRREGYSSRKITNWAAKNKAQPSMLWLIERAPTEELLIEMIEHCLKMKEANASTRKRWAEAAERRFFLLKRNPPKYEKIGVAEVFSAEELKDPRQKSNLEAVIQDVLDNREFDCAMHGDFKFDGLRGQPPISLHDYFRPQSEVVDHTPQPPVDGLAPLIRGADIDGVGPVGFFSTVRKLKT